MRELVWSYGVTTVPLRLHGLLPQTLESLRKAGFENPRIFVDGCSYGCMPTELLDDIRLQFTIHYPAVDAYANWVLAIWELYLRKPKADRYAIFQDDILLCRNLRSFLNQSPYPEKGYLNLYTMNTNEEHILNRPTGWYPSDQLGRGAVALVFDKAAVSNLLSQPHLVGKPLELQRGNKNIDGAVVTALVRRGGFIEYVHNPSLVQHVGEVSTLNNRSQPQARTWRGESYDAMELLGANA